MSDITELVKKAKRGDFSAFEKLVKSHSAKVYSVLLRITGNSADAEDGLQETFLRVFKSLNRLRGDENFSIWLMRIEVNVARSIVRKREPYHFNIDTIPITKELFDWSENPELVLKRKELLHAIEKFINELPVEFREPFVLRDVEGFSVKDISKILGISESLVKIRAHRARLVLREKITQFFSKGKK